MASRRRAACWSSETGAILTKFAWVGGDVDAENSLFDGAEISARRAPTLDIGRGTGDIHFGSASVSSRLALSAFELRRESGGGAADTNGSVTFRSPPSRWKTVDLKHSRNALARQTAMACTVGPPWWWLGGSMSLRIVAATRGRYGSGTGQRGVRWRLVLKQVPPYRRRHQ